MILAHRKELLGQISKTLKMFRVKHDLIAPKSIYNSHYPTHVASVFSVVRKLDYIKVPDYVIIDEAHHAIPGSTWNKTLDHWRQANPKLRIIGVTATPERLSGEGLSHTFDTMVMGPSVAELIESRHLSPYKMFAPPRQVDTSSLHRRMGDFAKGEAAALMDKPTITGDAVAHYRKHLNGAPTIGFTVSVEHAYHVAETYRANGFSAATLEGKVTSLERDRIVKDFSRGAINYLSTCDLVSEGFDVPGAIGCQNLRPTESLAMCLQQWGRVLRYQNGKTAIILDHVGNSARHGLPDEDRSWSLEGISKGKRKNGDPDDIQIRQCGRCGAVNPASSRNCSECGTEFKIKPRKVAEVEGTLEEIRAHEKQKYMETAQYQKRLSYLIQLGHKRNYKSPERWAAHVMNGSVDKMMKQRVR